LVKRQIRRLEEPSTRCIELVHEEMQRIIQHCGNEVQQEMMRFPRLHEKIIDVVTNLLRSRLPPTNSMVENIVAIELSYINTKHPDFQREIGSVGSLMANSHEDYHNTKRSSTSSLVNKPTKNRPVQFANTPLANGDDKENTAPKVDRKGSKESVNSNNWISNLLPAPKNEDQRTGTGSAGDSRANENRSESQTESVSSQQTSKEPSPANTPMHNSIHHTDPSSAAANMQILNQPSPQKPVNLLPVFPEPVSSGRKLSEREKRDCEVIERLIKSYFYIVRKSIQDSVPKAIMHFLVSYVKNNLQSELVSSLYKQEEISSLLSESEHIGQRRKEAAEMLQALQKAGQIISEIRETHVW